MASVEKPAISPSFEAVLDAACEGLADKKIRYSVRRIREMEECLADLEMELDVFLRNRKEGGSA
ncbi:MAG: hypothetical protein LBI86_04720 [Treponema sp.]|jgi:hypothetical protein|nr:hypothetical protein [Treponema sp.]